MTKTATLLQRMEAEICFLHPNAASSATAALVKLGFDVELLDWVDPYSSDTRWIMARILTERTQSEFLDWVQAIVDPDDGFVVEAGLLRPGPVLTETSGG